MKSTSLFSKIATTLLLTGASHTLAYSASFLASLPEGDVQSSASTAGAAQIHKQRVTKDNLSKTISLAEGGDNNAACELIHFYANSGDRGQLSVWAAKVAESGDKKAQYNVGSFYAYNRIVQSDKKAAEFFALSANQDHPKALYALALCYRKGAGVAKSFSTAINLYTRAATLNEPNSLYALGEIHRINGEYENARSCFEQSVELGNDWGQYGLGRFYLEGFVGEGHARDALRLLELSAQQKTLKPTDSGNVRAKVLLGDYYRRAYTREALALQALVDEQVCPETNDLADILKRLHDNATFFRLAVGWYASAGDEAEARYKLHGFREIKLNVPMPDERAYVSSNSYPFRANADQSSCTKVDQAAFFPLHSDGALFPRAVSAMDTFITLSEEELRVCVAELTFTYSELLGSRMTLYSADQSLESLKCMYWKKIGNTAYNANLILAADGGDVESRYILGMKYLQGNEIARNEPEAVRYLAMSAEQNYSKAQYALAICHILGLGVEAKDTEAAVALLQKAAEQEDSWAQYYLGVCYFKGIGTPANEAEAKRLFQRIATKSNAAGYFLDEIKLQRADREDFFGLQTAAERGDLDVHYKLGISYLNGYGVEQNVTEAARYFELATTEENLAAYCRLAVLLRDGSGVAKDEARARRLLEYVLSIEKFSFAYEELAVFYEKGLGVPADSLHAHWLLSNASKNHDESLGRYAKMIFAEDSLIRASAGDRTAQAIVSQLYKSADSYYGLSVERAHIWGQRCKTSMYMIDGVCTEMQKSEKSYFSGQMGRQTSQPAVSTEDRFAANAGAAAYSQFGWGGMDDRFLQGVYTRAGDDYTKFTKD
ncbi:MAG: tetratricopeptide repeat protein [Pseudomonadota bacterium]